MFDNFEKDTAEDMKIQERMDLIREKLILENWNIIDRDGIDLGQIKNIPLLVDTLTQMLEYFEKTEEYEKCKVIYDYLKQI